MNCENFRELISAGLDGELTAEDEKAVSRHLAGCDGCREFQNEITGQRQLLAEDSPAMMPSEIQHEIRIRTAGRPKRAGLFSRLFSGSFAVPKPVAWVAGGLIIALAFYSAFRPGGRTVSPAGYAAGTQPERIQRVVITDRDVVKTQIINEKNKL